jgi:hypothetical protein
MFTVMGKQYHFNVCVKAHFDRFNFKGRGASLASLLASSVSDLRIQRLQKQMRSTAGLLLAVAAATGAAAHNYLERYPVLTPSGAPVQWQRQKCGPGDQITSWGATIDGSIILPEYPRPSLARSGNWWNLNGLWEFQTTTANAPIPFVSLRNESQICNCMHKALHLCDSTLPSYIHVAIECRIPHYLTASWYRFQLKLAFPASTLRHTWTRAQITTRSNTCCTERYLMHPPPGHPAMAPSLIFSSALWIGTPPFT